jgi:hypothetical protein
MEEGEQELEEGEEEYDEQMDDEEDSKAKDSSYTAGNGRVRKEILCEADDDANDRSAVSNASQDNRNARILRA